MPQLMSAVRKASLRAPRWHYTYDDEMVGCKLRCMKWEKTGVKGKKRFKITRIMAVNYDAFTHTHPHTYAMRPSSRSRGRMLRGAEGRSKKDMTTATPAVPRH
jgi:hypothetical protein